MDVSCRLLRNLNRVSVKLELIEMDVKRQWEYNHDIAMLGIYSLAPKAQGQVLQSLVGYNSLMIYS